MQHDSPRAALFTHVSLSLWSFDCLTWLSPLSVFTGHSGNDVLVSRRFGRANWLSELLAVDTPFVHHGCPTLHSPLEQGLPLYYILLYYICSLFTFFIQSNLPTRTRKEMGLNFSIERSSLHWTFVPMHFSESIENCSFIWRFVIWRFDSIYYTKEDCWTLYVTSFSASHSEFRPPKNLIIV